MLQLAQLGKEVVRFCLKAALGDLPHPPAPFSLRRAHPLCFQPSDSMGINDLDGPPHVTLHSSGFFKGHRKAPGKNM